MAAQKAAESPAMPYIIGGVIIIGGVATFFVVRQFGGVAKTGNAVAKAFTGPIKTVGTAIKSVQTSPILNVTGKKGWGKKVGNVAGKKGWVKKVAISPIAYPFKGTKKIGKSIKKLFGKK
jgi:hypothetical protein